MDKKKNSNTQNHWLKLINGLSKQPDILRKLNTNLVIS